MTTTQVSQRKLRVLVAKPGLDGHDRVAEIIGGITLDEWCRRMEGAQGQWALVQNAYEVGMDPALRENGFITKVVDADGVERELVANPVQFDEYTREEPTGSAVRRAHR